MTNERPETATGNVMFDLSPSLRVNVWLTGNVGNDTLLLGRATEAIKKWLEVNPKTRQALGILTNEEREAKRAERQQARQEGAQRQQPVRVAGTGVWCPEHNVEVKPSLPKYNRDGDKFFHSLPERDWYRMDDGRTAKSHSLYWRETVNGRGESNESKEMPGARQPVAAGARGRANPDYEGDIDPDNLPF